MLSLKRTGGFPNKFSTRSSPFFDLDYRTIFDRILFKLSNFYRYSASSSSSWCELQMSTPHREVPFYHIDEEFQMPSPESSSSSSSDFNEQRAAELRCEIAELRDVVQSQKAELDTKKNGSTRFRADMTRVKRELADLRKVSDDAIKQRSLSDTERERLTNELEEARKRYRQKGRVMKTKIDNQAASIETLEAKCTTLNNVRIKAERTASQSENQRQCVMTKMKLLEDSLSVATRERGKEEEKKEAMFSMLYMLFGYVLLSVVDERSITLN